MLVEYENARILITDQKLETIKDILPVLEQVTRVNQPLVIIAEDVTGTILGFCCFCSFFLCFMMMSIGTITFQQIPLLLPTFACIAATLDCSV